MAAAAARAAHAIPVAAPVPPPAGLAAGVGGAFRGCVAVAPLAALQVAHALVELRRGGKTSVADATLAKLADGRQMDGCGSRRCNSPPGPDSVPTGSGSPAACAPPGG